MGQVNACCSNMKEDYNLVDQIYEIDEGKAVSNLFKTLVTGKMETKGVVLSKVKYLVVVPDSCCLGFDLMRFVKGHI